MAKAFNKNSAYITSLVDFIGDVKPFRSKLTEIVEEYQFFDDMFVKIKETSSIKTTINPAWLYNFYSSGDPLFRSVPLKQLHRPYSGALDRLPGTPNPESTGLEQIPFVYSKKTFAGPGIAEVIIDRHSSKNEYLVEGLDFFQSHGSIQIKIKQTLASAGIPTDPDWINWQDLPTSTFVPSWVETRDENIVSLASAEIKRKETDITNPASAISLIKSLLQRIEILDLTPEARAAVNSLLGIIGTGALPRDYESLLNQLSIDDAFNTKANSIGFTGWVGNDTISTKFVSDALSALSPSLYFDVFTDFSILESGEAQYSDVKTEYLEISNIRTSAAAIEGETWMIVSEDSEVPLYSVSGLISGYIGKIEPSIDGILFNSPLISFAAKHIKQAPRGILTKLKNRNRFVFGRTAPLEAWDIIKVNPISYSRPVLSSTRYGYIESYAPSSGEVQEVPSTTQESGIKGLVSIFDPALPTGALILTATTNPSYFRLTSSIELDYTGLAQVDIPFYDGRIGFTIRSGTRTAFEEGDRFYIDIFNDPAKILNLDLGYGYDLDSYDSQDLNYDSSVQSEQKINFAYGSRFTDYDLSRLNVKASEDSVSGTSWRLRAIPNQTRPIVTIKKDGTFSANIDLQSSTSGISPDPALTAAPWYAMLGGSEADLELFYADVFDVQYLSGSNWVSIGEAPVGSQFNSELHGISFTLVPGNKPFVAVKSDDHRTGIVEGGDLISFEVQNNFPVLVEIPVVLSSLTGGARLIMHGDGFQEAEPAFWTISFTSPLTYTVLGIKTEGSARLESSGIISLAGTISKEGGSFKDLGIHFTIVPGTIGFEAGDKFTFSTFSKKPSFLVHGSVSGWKQNATVGEPYWNGIIGFTIEEPSARLFSSEADSELISSSFRTWEVGSGSIKLSRLRADAIQNLYTLTPTPINSSTSSGWIVSRSDSGPIGYLSSSGSFSDDYITIQASGFVSTDVISLQLEIIADDFALWDAQDVIIVRPSVLARRPNPEDFLLIDKRTVDSLAINLGYRSIARPPSIKSLSPINIDPRFISTSTGTSEFLLSNTSPETAILSNWIPLTIQGFDSESSKAEFSDISTIFTVSAAGSGELMGTLKPISDNPNYPVQFEWDLNFYKKYLPLNTEANFVTYGSGFNDVLNVRIRENLKILISGGALSGDALFNDKASVNIQEYLFWTISGTYQDSISAVINDGPFIGFLPGYDNSLYDEDELGYDTGLPLTDNFIEAQSLSGLIPLNPAQEESKRLNPEFVETRLNELLGSIGAFLNNGNLAETSLSQFLTNLNADPTISTTLSPYFGIPAVGLGIDITIGAAGTDVGSGGLVDPNYKPGPNFVPAPRPAGPSTEGASTSVRETTIIRSSNGGSSYDSSSFDSSSFDDSAESTLMLFAGPAPTSGSIPAESVGYYDFDTTLIISGANIIEIIFTNGIYVPTPIIYVWFEPSNPATPLSPRPAKVSMVQRISDSKFRFSIPILSEVKLILLPSS